MSYFGICSKCDGPAHTIGDHQTYIPSQICYVHRDTGAWVSCLVHGQAPKWPSAKEVRVTDPKTGGQKGRKPEAYAYIPVLPLDEVAHVYSRGLPDTNYVSAFYSCLEGFRCGQRDRVALAEAAAYALELMVPDRRMLSKDGRIGPAYDRIPVEPLAEVARVYHFGCHGKPTPYEPWNWAKGYDWNLSFSAAWRHAEKSRSGVSHDDESGLNHWAHAIFHTFSLFEFDRLGLGKDDRFVA